MLLKDIIYKGIETVSGLYPEGEAKEMVFAYLEDVFGIKRHAHIINPEYSFSDSDTDKAMADFGRMAEGEPLQYVTGKAYFYGREFRVTPDVLIPRGETEVLIQEAVGIAEGMSGKPELRILDMCTGSGCIAWTLALELQKAKVKAVDISDGALEVASSQALTDEASHAGATVPEFIKADVLEAPFESGYDFLQNGRYDIIVSNPPYVMDSERALMRTNVLDHEPHLALFVPDDDPLKFYTAVAEWAEQLLSPEGAGVVEINEALGEETRQVFVDKGFIYAYIVKDLHEKDRFVRFSRVPLAEKKRFF